MNFTETKAAPAGKSATSWSALINQKLRTTLQIQCIGAPQSVEHKIARKYATGGMTFDQIVQ